MSVRLTIYKSFLYDLYVLLESGEYKWYPTSFIINAFQHKYKTKTIYAYLQKIAGIGFVKRQTFPRKRHGGHNEWYYCCPSSQYHNWIRYLLKRLL